jgi:hypothetical protein
MLHWTTYALCGDTTTVYASTVTHMDTNWMAYAEIDCTEVHDENTSEILSCPRCVPRARVAKLREQMVSPKSTSLGLTCTSIKVFESSPADRSPHSRGINHR